MDNIINSPAFFDPKWLNASCSSNTWKSAIVLKIGNAVKDIDYILSLQTNNIPSVLAHYYQTLSMDRVEEFIDSLQRAVDVSGKLKPFEMNDNHSEDIPIIPVSQKDIDQEKKGEYTRTIYLAAEINLDDLEVLSHIANSINPYTGEVITGIDDSLRERILIIIKNIKQLKLQKTNEDNTIASKNANSFLNELALKLSDFAKEKAAQEGVVCWKILRRKSIDSLCKHLPVSKEELYSKHVLLSRDTKEKYGEEITKIIRVFIDRNIGEKTQIIDDALENEPILESMVGKPWTKEEETKLIEEFNRGLQLQDIATLHNRKNGGIRARLKRLGLIE